MATKDSSSAAASSVKKNISTDDILNLPAQKLLDKLTDLGGISKDAAHYATVRNELWTGKLSEALKLMPLDGNLGSDELFKRQDFNLKINRERSSYEGLCRQVIGRLLNLVDVPIRKQLESHSTWETIGENHINIVEVFKLLSSIATKGQPHKHIRASAALLVLHGLRQKPDESIVDFEERYTKAHSVLTDIQTDRQKSSDRESDDALALFQQLDPTSNALFYQQYSLHGDKWEVLKTTAAIFEAAKRFSTVTTQSSTVALLSVGGQESG